MLDTVGCATAPHLPDPQPFATHDGGCVAGIPRVVEDAAYLLRGNPGHPEHDELGLRNPGGIQDPELVVIGGGQVYGVGVPVDQTWPALLQRRQQGGVLNAGLPGWGSVQYALAAEELSALSPRHMMVCLTPASDLVQAFTCASLSASVLARSFFDPQWAEVRLPDPAALNLASPAIKRFMAEHPGLAEEDALAVLSQRGEPDVNPCVLDASRFYLAEGSLLAMLDLEQPAVEAGLHITVKVLEHLQELSRLRNIRLTILLLPTREHLVSLRLDKAHVRERQGLERLGLMEAAVLGHLRAACARQGLRCFDLTAYLQQHVGSRIHAQNSRQGQLTAKGCELVARFVRARVLPGATLRTARTAPEAVTAPVS